MTPSDASLRAQAACALHLVGCACSRLRTSASGAPVRAPRQEVLTDMQLRRRLKLILALAALVAVVIPMTFAIGTLAFDDDTPPANATVVKVENKKAPRKKVLHKRLRRGWAHPTPGQVREIIRNEAR